MTRIVIEPTEALEPQLAAAVDVLERGGVVAYPTDTLYGLAADPRKPEALERLTALKGRGSEKAVALIAATVAQAQEVAVIEGEAMVLARAFWPGPLTLVVPARPHIVEPIRSADGCVGVRVPAHAVARALAQSAGTAITATSANPSGGSATADPGEVARMLPDVDAIVDVGVIGGGPPSTLVRLVGGDVQVLREGAIARVRVLESLGRTE